VEVVDADGRPAADVVVTVRALEAEATLAFARTDVSGRATLAIDSDGIAESQKLRVGTPWIASTPPGVTFTIATLPSERSRLVLAPSGSIEIVLVGGEEFPIEADAECYLRLDEDRCAAASATGMHDTAVWTPLRARTVLFPRVGLNLCFAFACRLPSVEYRDVEFDGPRNAGDHVRVEVPFTASKARIQGRLLDVSGVPLAAHDLRVDSIGTPTEPHSTHELFRAHTDAEGRFVAHVRARELPGAGPRLALHAATRGGLPYEGFADWPGATASKESVVVADLGDVHAAGGVLLASGRVVDARGKPPQPWQQVEIQLRPLDHDVGHGWYPVGSSIGSDGGFRVGLAQPVERFELRAGLQGCAPGNPVEAVRGVDGLVLVLRDGCRIEGRLLLPEGVAIGDLDIEFTCTDPPASPDHHVNSFETNADGTFNTSSILPGKYSVIVSLDEHQLGSRDVALSADGAVAHLEPLDLRDLVHSIHVTVVAEGAERIENGSVAVVQGLERLSRSRLTREGSVNLVSLAKTLDVIAAVPGFRTTRFDGVASGARLVLDRGLAISVRVDPAPRLPDGCVLELEFVSSDPLASFAPSPVVRVDASGEVGALLPCPGSYALHACIRAPGVNDRIEIALKRPTSINVRDSVAVPEVQVEFEEASLQSALERVRRH
jgi:hypothetical protein